MVINKYHIIGLVLYTTLIVVLTYLLTRPNATVDGLTIKERERIDSLNIYIVELEHRQRVSDDLIVKYKQDINLLNHKIDSTKTRVIQIRSYYENKLKNVSRYTPTELDNFFSARYNKQQ